MQSVIKVVRQPAALTLTLLLAACGGGGGSDSAPPPTTCDISITADSSVAAGKTAGASALSVCSAYITTIAWTQVSGPAVTLAAARSPTVAIETANVTGTIRLRADATLSDGRATSATTDIVVAAPVSGSFVTVRADHALRVGTDTSVRAWPTLADGDAVGEIVWTQTAGPAVSINKTVENVLLIQAPASAAADTAFKFRATMTTMLGKVDFDEVIVSVDRQAATPNGYIFKNTARVHPYAAGGAYSNVLARCSYDVGLYFLEANNTLCSAATLPLIQADATPGGIPSVADIMSRVLVSHDFLGANFEKFLTTQDSNQDFRRMLGAVTTIVIGSHVRPSFYQPATGAIYLDANYLWLTPEQRDVVTEVPDYRLAFDDALNFTSLGRQIKNNEYARFSYPATERVTRPESDLIVGLGRLLYHELAHAGDFFAPSSRTLDSTLSIYGNVAPRIDSRLLPSDDLARTYPLMSAQMKRLGQVMFLGVSPTAAEKAYTAAQVGAFFATDVASDEYAYSINGNASSREDLAMLFEEFMMKYRHGIQYDVAYSNVYSEGMTSDDLIVQWGQRGRIGSASIKPRVKLVLSKVAPWIDQAAVDALPAPIQMTPGISWESNRVLSAQQPVILLSGSAQPARLLTTLAEKRSQARTDVAGRRHAH